MKFDIDEFLEKVIPYFILFFMVAAVVLVIYAFVLIAIQLVYSL